MANYYRKDSSGLIFKVENGNVFCFNKKENAWKISNKPSIDFTWNGIDYEELREDEVNKLINA